MGYSSKRDRYEMDGRNLEAIREERDFGVIVQEDLRWSRQCMKAMSTANLVLRMIKDHFVI
jgi:hypothetical protein